MGLLELPAWRTITRHDVADVVLAVDFGPGRPEAGFEDLAALLDIPVTMLETVPGLDGFAADAHTQVCRWADPLRGSGTPVLAVLGYCVGSAFACAIADELAVSSPVVVFDPEPADAAGIAHQFALALSTFGDVNGPELEGTLSAGRAVLRADDPRWVHAKLLGLYADACTSRFERAGLDRDFADELIDRFAEYLHYLQLAAELGLGGRPPTLVVTSATPGSGYRDVRNRHPFEVQRAALLRDRRVGRLVSGLLT